MHIKHFTTRQLAARIFIYIVMAVSVVTLVTIITMFMLGFRLSNGSLEQYALLQFSSTPSGATVSVDGNLVGSKTPNKQSIPAGQREVVIWREGYRTWRKSIDAKTGAITWLNYALLVPKDLKTESVAKYTTIDTSLASPKGDRMLIGQDSNRPIFDLVNINSDKVKTAKLEIASKVYSSAPASAKHNFNPVKWDEGGRYVLIDHMYGSKHEWLVLDTESAKLTQNITATFDITVTNVIFIGSSGNLFYVLDKGDVRKLDVAAGTISKPLISNVDSFDYYSKSKVITYIGRSKDSKQKIAGLFREGDDKIAVIKTVDNNTALFIATTRYFNENYIAVLGGQKLEIFSGSYPNTTSDNSHSLKTFAALDITNTVTDLSFSPNGEYVFVRTGKSCTTYDLEYQNLSVITDVEGSSVEWLNDNYLWSDQNDKLVIREFDGTNSNELNEVITGHDVVITSNGRYIYSIGRSDDNRYQLQRVRMILP